MKSKILWGLIAVNALLLAAWVARTQTQSAVAQVHRPADYITIPGEVVQSESGVVYIVDVTNGQLGAMTYDTSRKRLDVMPPIDLNRIFEQAAKAGAGKNAGGTPPKHR